MIEVESFVSFNQNKLRKKRGGIYMNEHKKFKMFELLGCHG
jgi:hypothetical protein